MDVETTAELTAKPKKPKRKMSGRVKNSGAFSIVNRSVLGMPMFDPAAREKRGRNRLIETTLKVAPNQEHRIKLICAIRLGADDLDCLLTLIYLAGKQGLIINVANPPTTQRIDIVDGLETRNVRKDPETGFDIVEAPTDGNLFLAEDHLRVHTTLYAFCKEMGLEHGGSSYALVEERLERLRNVAYTDYGPIGGNSRRFMSGARQTLLYYRHDEARNDELVVVLNARLSAAILGQSFARVRLDHYHSLSSDTARILFVRLCAAIRDPGSLRIALDKLVDWVYFEGTEVRSTHSMRKKIIREAIDAISKMEGWHASLEDKGKQVLISRGASARANCQPSETQGSLILA